MMVAAAGVVQVQRDDFDARVLEACGQLEKERKTRWKNEDSFISA